MITIDYNLIVFTDFCSLMLYFLSCTLYYVVSYAKVSIHRDFNVFVGLSATTQRGFGIEGMSHAFISSGTAVTPITRHHG